MKRFYTRAEVAVSDTGFSVTLDGRTVRTPAGHPLVLPHQGLAAAVAAEWLAQGETVKPHEMPMMQLASTALDRVAPSRDMIINEMIRYAGTDLLCYRAESPQDLVERQRAVWQPILDWIDAQIGAPMPVTTGLLPIAPPDGSVGALRAHITAYDDIRLTALQNAVASMGSLLLGIALVDGHLTAEEAFAASQLDETYQIELWGEDPEATKRREVLRNDIAASARLLELCLPQYPPMRS